MSADIRRPPRPDPNRLKPFRVRLPYAQHAALAARAGGPDVSGIVALAIERYLAERAIRRSDVAQP